LITAKCNIQVRQREGEKPILLSICIPTYNRSNSLKILLDEIYHQSKDIMEAIEVVISDNASTDDTPSVIDKYRDSFPIFVVNRWEKNTGTRYNVCNIPMFASGKYVWFLCDDDLLEDNIIIDLFQFIESNDKLALISLNWINTDKHAPVYSDLENRVYASAEDIFIRCGEYMALCSALIVMRSVYLAHLTDGVDRNNQLWFPHFIVSMRGAATSPCGYFGKPVIKRYVVDQPDWHSETAYIWLIDYPRSVLSLVSYGYDISKLQACLETPWQESFLRRVIRYKQIPGLRKMGVSLFSFWKVNSFRTGFYSRILPLFLVPSFIHRNMARLIRFIKHPFVTGNRIRDRIRRGDAIFQGPRQK
jgi:glycosyltransferase involved in cell wall biosynthesis